MITLADFPAHPLLRCHVVQSIVLNTAANATPHPEAADGRRESALARLFVAHNQELLSFLMSRLGSAAEAHEVIV